MSHAPDPDRLITAWLDDRAVPGAPAGLIDETLARTSRLHRRPVWRIPERWIPMPITMRLAVVPRAFLYLLLLALLAMLLAAGGLVVGSRRHAAVALPPPTGLARNGLIAYDSGGDIWVMNPDGTGRQRRTSGPGIDIWPTWSVDGTRIAYWSWPSPTQGTEGPGLARRLDSLLASGDASLMVMDADGSAPRAVLTGATLDGQNLYLSWSPDSRHLVASRLVDGTHMVTLLSVDGTAPVDLVPGETPAWSPDGSQIAYRTLSVPSGVWAIRPDGSRAHQVTTASGSGGAFYLSQWAPDGAGIVFYAGSDGGHDVWTIAADGSDERPLSTDFHDEYWPSWSPAGDRIVYSRVLGGWNRPVYVLTDPAGSSEQVLDAIPQQIIGSAASWSPDAAFLLGGDWQAGQVGFDLHVIRIPDRGAPEVTVVPLEDNVGVVSWQRLAP